MSDFSENEDLYAQPMRRTWLFPVLLSLLAATLYFFTLSPVPFPGVPAHELASHLLLNTSIPFLSPVWGAILRLLPHASPAFSAAALSALFGAASILLLVAIVQRVRFSVHDKDDPDEIVVEHRARRLAAVVSGLYLAVCYPFWVHATRSLPGTFHVFLLLLVVWIFSEYQRRGDTFLLCLFGLLYGLGCVESATFFLFAPLAAALVLRAMLQRAAFRWSTLVLTFLFALPPAVIYLAQARFLWYSSCARLCGYESVSRILGGLLRAQWRLIVGPAMAVGFLLVLVLVIIPWCILFLVRTKKPAWRYSFWQVFLRVCIFVAAALALAEVAISPCRVFGIHDPLVVPHLVLAACLGRVVGEFLVMGALADRKPSGVLFRRLFGALAWATPALVLALGLARNFRAADGRAATPVHNAIRNSLRNLDARDILISNGGLDDDFLLAAKALPARLRLVALPKTSEPFYRDILADSFSSPRQRALLQVGFAPFIQDFLREDANLVRVASFDADHILREFGYLVPNGFLCSAVPTPDRVPWDDLPGTVTSLRDDVDAIRLARISNRNPAAPFANHLLRVASKSFNNIGFSLMERGDRAQAKSLFETARECCPENASALLNLLTIAAADLPAPDAPKPPELAALEEEWDNLRSRLNNRALWNLGPVYGYLFNPALFVRSGMMWAASGRPRNAEAEFRRVSGGRIVNPAAKAFLAHAFLAAGDEVNGRLYYEDILRGDPSNFEANLKLAEIAMATERLDDAAEAFEKARSIRPDSPELAFDDIAFAFVRGDRDDAVVRLKAWTADHKSDARAWAILAFVSGDGSDPKTFDQALKALKSLRSQSPAIRLLLAELYASRHEWTDARDELEQILRLNPRMTRPLEMIIDIDFQERKRELAEDHVRQLLSLDPASYIGNLMLASFQYERNQLSLAESSYRAALAARRTPVALNDLACILLRKDDVPGARALVDEALPLAPDNFTLLSTHAEILLREQRLDEAESVLQRLLSLEPDDLSLKFLSASLCFERGQLDAALELAEAVRASQADLPQEAQNRLADLLSAIRAAMAPDPSL